eukprot:scaffold7242_cov400-Prasinococcus_capsulatus_cf.AAC.6
MLPPRGPNGEKLFTLVMLFQGDDVLLGEKKRGFGAGYYNGFGGKVEAGETVEEGAYREFKEESGAELKDAEHCGVLTFRWVDEPGKPDWNVHVFRSAKYEGELTESEEMRPCWYRKDAMPYGRRGENRLGWPPYCQAVVGLY